jgi:hypothetical protein
MRMHRFVIDSPKRITVTVQVEVVYDSDQYIDDADAAQEALYIVAHAATDEREEYMHFESATLIGHMLSN